MRRICSRLLATVAAVAAAGTAVSTEVWTPVGTITSVEVVESGGFLVRLSGGVGTACTAANAVYIYAGQHSVTADGQKALLAIALTAFTAGKPVSILYDDSTANCWGRYISATQ